MLTSQATIICTSTSLHDFEGSTSSYQLRRFTAFNMRDPFISPPKLLSEAVQPIADCLGLLTLPLHIHEVLFSWACYQFIFTIVSPTISNWLLPSIYARFPARTKVNWNVHVTSFIQSTFITSFALFVILRDEDRKKMGWVGRILGYTGAGGAVQGFAAGYFLWDAVASIMHLKVLGWGSLIHAVSALLVTSLGFVRYFPFTPLLFYFMGLLIYKQLAYCRIAPIRKLLWLEFHSLRDLYSVLEHPLVLR